MKSVVFEGTIAADGHIAIPAEIAGLLPPGERLRVILQSDGSGDGIWRTQGWRRFEAAYASEDSVYDQLMDETR